MGARGTAALAAMMLATLVVAAAQAGREKEPDPFRAHPDSLTRRYGRVAVAHVITIGASRIPSPDAYSTFETRIGARLDSAGFSAIPAETVLAGWKASIAAVGGIFDVRTGRPDTTRMHRAEARMADWLRDSLACDSWLRYELVEVLADYDAGEAHWDGYSTDVGARGVVATLLIGSQKGKIRALSLEVEISDLRGRVLYTRRGALQPRNRMVKNHWIQVPFEEVRNEDVARRGLDLALGPWVAKVAPRGAAE